MPDNPPPRFHRIRLHGPWQAQVVGDNSPDEQQQRQEMVLKIPCDWGDWLGTRFYGRVLFVRVFGKPTALAEGQRVWINVLAVEQSAEIRLNETLLGRMVGRQPTRFRIDHLLRRGNRLEVEVTRSAKPQKQPGAFSPFSPGGLIGSVFLEIEE